MTTRHGTIILPAALLTALVATPRPAISQGNEEQTRSVGGISVWLAYQSYRMDEFNTKMRSEGKALPPVFWSRGTNVLKYLSG